MRSRSTSIKRSCLAALAVSALTAACSGVLGIHDPVIDDASLLEGGLDGSSTVDGVAADQQGGGRDGSSTLTCTAPTADCNLVASDGCEIDLSKDAKNCGACGHDCLVTACLSGTCQPQTLTLTPALTDTTGFLAVNATRAFLLAPFVVHGFPKAGGASQSFELFAAAFRPATLAARDTSLLVAGYNVFSVKGYDLVGGTTSPGAGPCTGGLGVIADETGAVYYAHNDDGVTCNTPSFHLTKRTPSGGGTFTTAWDIEVSGYVSLATVWLALDATSVYFASQAAPSASPGIYAAPRAGGAAPTLVIAGTFDNAPIAVVGGSLFTVADSSTASAAVISIDLATKTKKVLATGERAFVVDGWGERGQIAADATHVYWTAADGAVGPTATGRIMRARRDGTGAKETIAGKQPGAYGLALDESFLYWSSATGIHRVAR